jgi:hypothetical protein
MTPSKPQDRPTARRLAIHARLATFVLLAMVVAAPAFAQAIADSALKEIAAIEQMKHTLTPAEQKMSMNLVVASRLLRHQDVPAVAVRVLRDSFLNGKTNLEVDIKAVSSDAVANDIAKGGDTVVAHTHGLKHLRARVRLARLTKLAEDPNVLTIREADLATTNVGSVTSQGYISHRANQAVAAGVTGAGVTVGVISDTATAARVSALIASGDLPPTTIVIPGQDGTAYTSSPTDEGTAMMEIVHDIAPGANLVFATGEGGQANFANNIRNLRFVYHCDIIVDDLTYFAEGAFQDGTVAQAVNDVTADGALYFSAAANSGNLTLNTSGTWEGDFRDGGPVSGVLVTAGETGEFHNFGTVTSPQNYDVLTATSQIISLKWSDPLGASTNDYDLFVLNSTGATLKSYSAAAQTGTQDPLEILQYTPAAGDRIVVVLYDGVARALRLDTNRGQLSIKTAGSTFGHNAAANTMTTAATYWNSAKTGTKPFVGFANPIETFSSDGPRQMFYNPDGTAITPGNVLFSTNGGATLQKPDVTAADGVATRTPGFLPFFGTSAAAPHAAGVAALVKSANLSLTNAQIRQILINSALDNMAVGADRDAGYGIVMAYPAVMTAKSMAAQQ